MKKHPTPPKARSTEKPKSEPVIPPVASEPANDSNIEKRLAIPLDKEGRVLLENMRESSRDKLKELLSNRDLAKELGIGASETAAPAMALPPQLMYPLISGLSIIEVLIVAKATNAPRDIVERVVPYSREEAQLLAPALAGVLEKYSGQFLVKYEKEAALAALLVSMTIHKISLVNEELEKRGPRGVVLPMTPVPSTDPQPPATRIDEPGQPS